MSSTASSSTDSTGAPTSSTTTTTASRSVATTGLDAGTCTLPGPGGNGGTLQFAESFGNTGAVEVPVVAIDPNSNDIVIAAGLQGSVNFGTGLKTSHGASGYDMVLARFTSSGAVKWSKDFGNGMLVGANSVAVDASGNVFVAGVFEGSLSFGRGTLSAIGTADAFLAKFDSAGAFRWSESFGSARQVTNLDTVAVDPSGNVLIAGVANGPTDFGGGAVSGFYIAKFSPSGAYAWSDGFVTSSTSSSPRLAVDLDGNAILAGSFSNTADFGGDTLTSAGSSDAFLAKFSPSGVYQWAKQYGDADVQEIHDVAVDACGNILVSGNFGSTITFGSTTLTGPIPYDSYAFLAKLDPAGTAVWAEEFEGSGLNGSMNAGSIAVDAEGGPTTTYGLAGSVDFGGGMLTSPGTTNVAVASFDASGTYRWAYAAGAASTAAMAGATGVAASGTRVLVVGSFGTCTGSCTTSPAGTTLDLAGMTLDAVSSSDLFIGSFAP